MTIEERVRMLELEVELLKLKLGQQTYPYQPLPYYPPCVPATPTPWVPLLIPYMVTCGKIVGSSSGLLMN